MRKTAIKILGYTTLILVICALFHYHQTDIISVFTHVKWSYVGLLSIIHIPMVALGGLSFKFLCSHYQINLRWTEWAG
ncbi:MAG TPA: hypothetical protein PLD88_03160, partial [Candidatus Berkiella sp.]|nr:hypothetical protein [Candidatus Berkiella sp.]